MNPNPINKKYLLLIATFIAFYFYLKFRDVSNIVLYVTVGIFTATIAYCLFSAKIKMVFRMGLSLLIIVAGLLLPDFLKGKLALQNKVNVVNNIEQKLMGSWVTDTALGYSIALIIQEDSAYLSQSNLPISKSYEWDVNDDFLALINNPSDQYLSWKYALKDDDSKLMLISKNDTLVFKRE